MVRLANSYKNSYFDHINSYIRVSHRLNTSSQGDVNSSAEITSADGLKNTTRRLLDAPRRGIWLLSFVNVGPEQDTPAGRVMVDWMV